VPTTFDVTETKPDVLRTVDSADTTGVVGTAEDVGVEIVAGTARRHFLPVLLFTQRSVMPFDTTVRPTFTHFEPGDEANETEPVPKIAKRRRTKTEMSFTFMLTEP
jgi:hypothetical protein